MKRGLILGRFQPFHFGHLELIKEMIKGGIEPLSCSTPAGMQIPPEVSFVSVERAAGV